MDAVFLGTGPLRHARAARRDAGPRANAGADATAAVGAAVTLDGSASSDVDGDPLTYAWSIVSKPAASQTTLAGATTVAPSLTIDASGTYVVQLIANDGHVDSAAGTMAVSTTNTRPVASAGPDQAATVGETVRLDGSASTDIDGNPLTDKWALTTKPAGSARTIAAPADRQD